MSIVRWRMFTKRTTKPKNNKCYIRKSSGGWSNAIKGKPMDKYADVLSNCVGYSNGRFAEIMNEIFGTTGIKYQIVCNAENFIEKAKSYGLRVAKTPHLGGIMVWQKGKTLKQSDGAGHVAIVEEIYSSSSIYTSESNYGGKAFLNVKRSNANGRWGLGSAYSFRGCIVNPAVDPTKTNEELAYEVLDGKWGNGTKRKKALEDEGYDYEAVQEEVNRILAEEPHVGDKVYITGQAKITAINGDDVTLHCDILQVVK